MTLDSHLNYCRISQKKHARKKQDLEQISHEIMGVEHGSVMEESELEYTF